jgi:hypothetical protein
MTKKSFSLVKELKMSRFAELLTLLQRTEKITKLKQSFLYTHFKLPTRRFQRRGKWGYVEHGAK